MQRRARAPRRWSRGAPALALLAVLPLLRAAEPADDGAGRASSPAYRETAVTGGGSLTGRVTAPPPRVSPDDVIVNRDQGVCGLGMPQESILRSADGGLKNAVVFFESIPSGKPIDTRATLKLDNHLCRIEPHVAAVAVGQRVQISNSDPILHKTHARLDGRTTIFSIALPVQNQRIAKTIRRPGLMTLDCDAGHPWTRGFVYAFTHPYFAVTDENGAFRIDQVPAGRWKVTAWHEELGRETREIVIDPGGDTTVTFDRLAKDPPRPRS